LNAAVNGKDDVAYGNDHEHFYQVGVVGFVGTTRIVKKAAKYSINLLHWLRN
jgi:hypothetical protein